MSLRAFTLPFTVWFAALALVSLTGCPNTTPVDRTGSLGFAPLESPGQARMPTPGDGPVVAVAKGAADGFVWAHVNAMLEASEASACDQLRATRVVNRSAVSGYVTRNTADGFVITNVIDRAVINFEFDITWRVRRLDTGGCEARWELTRGPTFLRRNRGWLRISAAEDQMTLLEMQHELSAPRVDPDKPAGYLGRLHERIAGLVQ